MTPESWELALEGVLASSAAMCLAWGQQATVLCNASFWRLVGETKAALGRPLAEVWPELGAAVEAARAAHAKSGDVVGTSRRITTPTGDVDVCCTPVLLKDGQLGGVLVRVERDRRVTVRQEHAAARARPTRDGGPKQPDRVQLATDFALCEARRRESEERYVALFERSPVATSLTRVSDRVRVSMNAVFRALFGLAETDAGESNVARSLVAPSVYREVMRRFLSEGRVTDFECRAQTKDGKELTVCVDVVAVHLGGLLHALTTVRDLTPLRRAEHAAMLYERSKERLLDLEAMERLQHVSALFLRGDDPREVLDAILDAAIAVTEADFGSIQVLDTRAGQLQLAVQRGLSAQWVQSWSCAPPDRGAPGAALLRRTRIVVPDVMNSEHFPSAEACALEAEAGVRAMQSTPLLSRSGAPLGVITTHYRGATTPSARALRFLDLLVRQAADILERQQSEVALRRAEAKATSLYYHSADAIISVNDAQEVIGWNQGAESIFGYPRAEALGMTLGNLIPTRYRRAHHDHVAAFSRDAAVSRRMDHATAAGLRKNGEEFPISATISSIDVDGQHTMTVCVRDISDEKRNENEQRLLAQVSGVLSTGDLSTALSDVLRELVQVLANFAVVFTLDEGGSLRRVGAASRDPEDAWMAESMLELPADPQPDHPALSVVASLRPIVTELEPRLYEGLAQSPAHLQALRSAAPRSTMVVPLVAGGACVGLVGLASTSGRFESRDLRLAEEIARRMALFVDNARLHEVERRAIRTRDDVLAVVPHDLRNPLNAIVLQTHLLQRRNGGPERRSQRAIEAIRSSAQRMGRILNDLLDVTRLEAGKPALNLVPGSAAELLADAAAASHDLSVERGLAFRTECEPGLPAVLVDKARIHQVMDNLVANAMKFTERGSIVVRAQRHDEYVLFSVSDTGSGIESDHLPHLFDRFWQARHGARDGAGLGLAIVKGFVEAHGGRVWAESRVGKGTTFYFTLPAARQQATTS